MKRQSARLTVANARGIAQSSIIACTTVHGLIAGTHHFVDLWARDSLFATFGASPDVAKTTIDTFLKYQRRDGLVPYRIFRRWMLLPNFRSIQSGGLVPDGGLMTIIAARRFGKMYKKQIRRAVTWYKKQFGNDLVSEWFQCEWADAVLKVGKTLYTNILYWKATGDETIKKKIVDVFWNGRYFADWIDWRRRDYFASHPNMLAIIFGLTTKAQSLSILDYAKEHCWNGWTLEENYPAYPWWRIPIQHYLVGMADYHNRGCLWLQPGILYAVALYKSGKTREAKSVFSAIADKILEYNGVYEVYEKSGRPVNRLFYRSEYPFAWSAGLFLWAYKTLYG